MNEIKRIKDNYYDYIYKYYSFVNGWGPYSYRKIKTVIYVNVSAWLVYLFLKLKIKPNTVTLVYALMGLLGGILLALPSNKSVILAILFFYLRPFLDWADGPLARELNQTSITGDIMDSYGAYLGWAALWVGLGLYLARTTGPAFYLLSPLPVFFFAVDLYTIARERFICHHLDKKEQEKLKISSGIFTGADAQTDIVRKNKGLKLKAIKNIVDAAFEHNARTVDLICLSILIEIIFSISILWVYYLLFLAWQACVFMARIAILYRGGWAENQLRILRKTLYA